MSSTYIRQDMCKPLLPSDTGSHSPFKQFVKSFIFVKIYACFVDLSKAFDTINRQALFHKMSKYNIKGPFLNII